MLELRSGGKALNILLKMAFRGTHYHGFQVQKNALAVCEVLQDAMEQVLRARPDVKGCSRTDAGVHAREYCVNFRFETPLEDRKIPLALNRFLPEDIKVWKAQRVPEEFHARYSATGKEYEYVFLNAPVDDPFCQGLYYRVYPHLDEKAMDQAAKILLGKHDFSGFMSAGSDIEDTVRTITRLDVQRRGNQVIMTIAADGFLYNMVRIIAGTLLPIGAGKKGNDFLENALKSGNRQMAGETMPAKGLFLNRVFYPEDALHFTAPGVDET